MAGGGARLRTAAVVAGGREAVGEPQARSVMDAPRGPGSGHVCGDPAASWRGRVGAALAEGLGSSLSLCVSKGGRDTARGWRPCQLPPEGPRPPWARWQRVSGSRGRRRETNASQRQALLSLVAAPPPVPEITPKYLLLPFS